MAKRTKAQIEEYLLGKASEKMRIPPGIQVVDFFPSAKGIVVMLGDPLITSDAGGLMTIQMVSTEAHNLIIEYKHAG